MRIFNDEEVKSIIIRATHELVAENENILNMLSAEDSKMLIDRLLKDRLRVIREQILSSQ